MLELRSPLEALLGYKFFRDAACVDRQPVVEEDAAQLDDLVCRQIELQQARQLSVAILFHHIDALVRGDKIMDLMSKWIGADAKVIRIELVFLLDLVQALAEREARRTVSQEAHLRRSILHD